ncbi:hypothetical protein BGX21_010804 [Mortierella sp. AD011]|nr:hypothetical protein BGX21_010804 [Mortierella sp. AD011]
MPLCSPTFLEHVLSTLKKLIKAEKTPKFDDIAVDILTLWKASIPVTAATKHNAMLITRIDDKEELLPMDELLDVFGDTPAKKTVHVIAERPSQGATNIPHVAQGQQLRQSLLQPW